MLIMFMICCKKINYESKKISEEVTQIQMIQQQL